MEATIYLNSIAIYRSSLLQLQLKNRKIVHILERRIQNSFQNLSWISFIRKLTAFKGEKLYNACGFPQPTSIMIFCKSYLLFSGSRNIRCSKNRTLLEPRTPSNSKDGAVYYSIATRVSFSMLVGVSEFLSTMVFRKFLS